MKTEENKIDEIFEEIIKLSNKALTDYYDKEIINKEDFVDYAIKFYYKGIFDMTEQILKMIKEKTN